MAFTIVELFIELKTGVKLQIDVFVLLLHLDNNKTTKLIN